MIRLLDYGHRTCWSVFLLHHILLVRRPLFVHIAVGLGLRQLSGNLAILLYILFALGRLV